MSDTIECKLLHEALRAGEAIREQEPLSAELSEHVRACPACAELFGSAETLGRVLAQSEAEEIRVDTDALFQRLERDLARPVGFVERVRQASTRARSIALFGIMAAIVALAAATLSRADLSIYPLPLLLGSIAALLVAALAAGAVVVRPIHRKPLPGWLLGVLAGFAVITPGVIACVPAVPHDHPSTEIGMGEQLMSAALGCFSIGMSFALLLVGAAWLVERSGLRRRAATVLGLVGAGALGNIVLILHCPSLATAHRLLGHASIGAVLLAAAAGVAWALVRPRPARR